MRWVTQWGTLRRPQRRAGREDIDLPAGRFLALARSGLAGLVTVLFVGAAHAQTTVGDLERAYTAYQSINDGGQEVRPEDRQRAGFLAGYLDATRERLQQSGRACPKTCRCYAYTALEAALFDAPDPRLPAARWLDEVLIKALPCS